MPIDFTPDQTSIPSINFTPDTPSSGGTSAPVNFAPSQPTEQSQQQGLLTRMGNDINSRMKNINDIQSQEDTGKVSSFPAEYQKASEAAQLAFADPVTGLMHAAGEDLYNSASSERQKQLRSIGNTVSGSITNGINYLKNSDIGQAAQTDINAVKPYYESSPNLQAMVKGTGNFAGALPMVGPEEAITKNLIDKIGTRASAAAKKDIPESVINKQAASNWFDTTAKKLPFNNDQSDKLRTTLENMDPTSNTQKYLWNKSGAAEKDNVIRESLANGQYTLGDAIDMHSDLNAAIKQAYLSKNDTAAAKLGKVKDALTEAMQNHDGSYEWQMANHEFSKGAAQQTLEEIIAKASTKAQPANSIDTSINNFLNSRKSSGLLPNEREALKNVASNSSSDSLKKVAASGLLKYAVPSMLPGSGFFTKGAGFLMSHYGSQLAKGSALANKLSKMDEVYTAINSRVPPVKAPTSGRALVPAGPVVNHMTDEQIAHAQRIMNRKGGSGGGNSTYSGASIVPNSNRLATGDNFGGANTQGNNISPSMIAGFAKNPSPMDLGPIGAASLPGPAGTVAAQSPHDLGYVGGASLPGPAGYNLSSHPSAEGYGMSMDDLYGSEFEPDINAYGPTKKKTGGKVNGKIGFNLKNKDK